MSSTSDNEEEAIEALECLTSPENQALNAELTGNMPSSAAGYDAAGGARTCSRPSSSPCSRSRLEAAAPRTVSPYWSDISSGIQSTWHPPSEVDQETPEQSKNFIEDILKGESLL